MLLIKTNEKVATGVNSTDVIVQLLDGNKVVIRYEELYKIAEEFAKSELKKEKEQK